MAKALDAVTRDAGDHVMLEDEVDGKENVFVEILHLHHGSAAGHLFSSLLFKT